jgi:hypothetical protein
MVTQEDSYLIRNDTERERLKALVARLSDDELSLPLGYGWTASVALAHLAFWDRRGLSTLEEWERTGVQWTPSDADAINDGMLAEWSNLAPQEAAQQAVEAAEAIDRKVAALSPPLVEAILSAGRLRSLDRSLHRREHLDEIEKMLARR